MIAPTPRRSTLLMVEDSDVDALVMQATIDDAAPGAFAITRVKTLAEAGAHLQTVRPDCALVDLGLPDAEGLEVVQLVAGRSPSSGLVVMTSRDDEAFALTTIEAGAGDFLSKPIVDGRNLVQTIRSSVLRKRSETSLAEAQRIAQIGSWEMDVATTAITWSHELCRLLGLPDGEAPSWQALLDRTHPDDLDAIVLAIRGTLEDGQPFRHDHRVVHPDGTVRWLRARGRVELDGDGQPDRLFGTAQDITEQREQEDARAHETAHDLLTGLPNRVLLTSRLSVALGNLARTSGTVVAICLDVDRFNVINESLGHIAGDQVLIALAARLKGLVRQTDTLGRTGGDEFAVVCEGLAGEAEAVRVADRFRDALTAPLTWEGGDLVVAVSAGIALTTSASADAGSLLRDADTAMYRAKAQGRNRSAVFATPMRTQALGRLTTEVALRRAIACGDLRVHYQPIVALSDGAVIGHEALVRWAHPARGLLGPNEFISIAEETGLIVPLGSWVLHEACRQATSFQARDPRWAHLTMSVNLSGAQLDQPDLVDLISSALAESELDPALLQLEMTESVLMDDAAKTVTILRSLKGLGVRLGLDDFGTGYSSLAYLKRFPVDVLKIDRSFVMGLGVDAEDAALVGAIVTLAGALHLTAVAEGVETELQREQLLELGCTRAQGYLFARPMPSDEIDARLDRIAHDAPSVEPDGGATEPSTNPFSPSATQPSTEPSTESVPVR